MLYLAKVQKTDEMSGTHLVLLVRQKSENVWSLVQSSLVEDAGVFISNLTVPSDSCPGEGFVLVDISDKGAVEFVQDATDWVLMVVEQYVSRSLTPETLAAEAERVEEWRQSLTLQSQDVVRRSLEVETRRDKIQEIEKGLEEKRTKLDVKQEKLEGLETQIEQDKQTLVQEKAALVEERQQIEQDHQILDAQREKLESLQTQIEQDRQALAEERAALVEERQQLERACNC